MPELPTGTVTFLFTDIEGSTRLAQQYPAALPAALARHHAIVRAAMDGGHGHVFRVVGDAFCVAFSTASDGLAAARAAQQVLWAEDWGAAVIRVRMGLHTGQANSQDGDYDGYLTLSHVQRLMSAASGGQVLLSSAVEGLVRDRLPAGIALRDLGEVRLKDFDRAEHVFQLSAPGLPPDFPPLKTLSAVPHNLPPQLTSFIGRQSEMAEVTQLLAATRLLTLTGPGGTGKTRLSLEVSAGQLDRYPAGIWFVDLAPLTDPAFVPQSVASALSVREQPGRPLVATLADHLAEKRALLILDNCEHLLDACAQLTEALLRACPRISVLATSREPLNIAGETVYQVSSLSVPPAAGVDSSSRTSIIDLAAYTAVGLFLARAAAARAGFRLTPANAPAIVQICARLDGIPLAIELAAARVRGLSVEQIAARLESSFQLLSAGSRTALPRQQTLHALIDWSYALLTDPERVVFRRLSIFAGGWTLEAAEAVCGDRPLAAGHPLTGSRETDPTTGEGALAAGDILDLLLRLQDKSLVAIAEREGRLRYRLLETVRQYARAKLLESGESARIAGSHLAYFLEIAAAAVPNLEASTVGPEAAMLAEDFDNVRAALSSALAHQPETALRMVNMLRAFWFTKGYIQEGYVWAERALAAAGALADGEGAPPPQPSAEGMAPVRRSDEAGALTVAGFFAFILGDYALAQSRLEAGARRAQALADPLTQQAALQFLGMVRQHQGDQQAARAAHAQSVALARQSANPALLAESLWLFGDTLAQDDPASARLAQEESLALHRQTGDRMNASFPLTSLAHLASQAGDFDRARALLEEAIAIRRAEGADYLTGISINSLAEVQYLQHQYESAAALAGEGLAMSRAVGNKSGVAWSLRIQGDTLAAQDDAPHAEASLRESLGLYRELGQKPDAAQVIESLAGIAHAQGRDDRAALLWGAANALRQAIAAPRSPGSQLDHDRSVAQSRARLGDAAFDAKFAAGRALALGQAIELALEEPRG